MIHETFRRFAASRRSAVAVIMAISLVPLMLLVGIAVDFTFLYQSKTQIAFASEAAATQALRIAAATYALEVANAPAGQSASVTNTEASAHALTAGQTAGNLWFLADLGSLTRATMTTATSALTSVKNTNPNGPGVGAPIFTAQVSPTTSYPPIFSPLFGSPTTKWVYANKASATTSYAYAQILLMLDTSGSMLIGADPSDILTMEQGTVCPRQGYVAETDPGNNIGSVGNYQLSNGSYNPSVLPPSLTTGLLSGVTTYNSGGSDTNVTGTCKTINGISYGLLSPTKISAYAGPYANQTFTGTSATQTPCALACHFANTKSTSPSGLAPNGLPADYYGLARAEGVTLRIDVLFSATEQVIQDMQNSQAVAGQLSVGVYQFNTDVFPLVTGATGTGGKLPEATSDLSSALSAVQAVDYKVTPTETAIPQLVNGTKVSTTPSSSVANIGGDTNFPMSLTDLQNGNATVLNGQKQPLTASGNGTTALTPLKFMFIVTDGLEDDSASNGDGNSDPNFAAEGEMTSIADEAAGTGTCSYLKNTLGYTVYVLYVDYYPLANDAYYTAPTPGARYTNPATNKDYPNFTNASIQTITSNPSLTNSPTAKALQACASSPADFQEANSSQSIKDALAAMLKSALASTIRLNN